MTETDIKKVKESFRDLWDGFTGLTIKAKDTKENEDVHIMFKDFCKEQTKDDYTLGLKVLLEYFIADGKYTAIWKAINRIEEKLETINTDNDKDDDKQEMF